MNKTCHLGNDVFSFSKNNCYNACTGNDYDYAQAIVLVNITHSLNRQSCCIGVTWLVNKRVIWPWGVIVLYEQLLECFQWQRGKPLP